MRYLFLKNIKPYIIHVFGIKMSNNSLSYNIRIEIINSETDQMNNDSGLHINDDFVMDDIGCNLNMIRSTL